MIHYISNVIHALSRPTWRVAATSLILLTCEATFATPAKSSAIPRYSYNAKEGNFTLLAGLSMSNYPAVRGTIIGQWSKLTYFSTDEFGFLLASDLPLTSGTIEVADVIYKVKLLPSKFGIFGAASISRRMSVTLEGGAGSVLVFGSGLDTALVPLLETGLSLTYDSGMMLFSTEVDISQCKGTVNDTAVDLSRKSIVLGAGIKL